MKEGARQLFRGLMQEMEPALNDLQGLSEEMRPRMRDFAQQMGPALRVLLAQVDDWSVYEPPEMLPNGDIILRHKDPAEPDPLKDPQPGDDIEI